MHENGLNFLLIEDNNKKIIDIIKENKLLEKVIHKSFQSSIKSHVTRVKKVDYKFDLKKIINLIKKEEYIFIFEKNTFYGVLNKTDLLWYLKKRENHA